MGTKFKIFFKEKYKNKRVFWISLIAILILLLILFLTFRNPGPKIKTAKIQTGYLESMVSASGMVKAPVYELGSKTGGKISALLIKEGQKVKNGQLLVKFDNYTEAKKNQDRTLALYKNGLASDQALESTKTALELAQIVSPSLGIIGKINFRAGETVVMGTPVLVVVDEESKWIEAQIDEIDIGSVKLGQTAEVTSDVYPDKKFSARLHWIAPLAELRKVGGRIKIDEESYVFFSKLKLLDQPAELKPNMSVNVEIRTKSNPRALIVPREALFTQDETTFVYKIKRNKAYQTKIEIGIRSYTSVEVTSGLEAGDIIAISKLKDIKDKGKIKIEK